jgi:hypothetical protein
MNDPFENFLSAHLPIIGLAAYSIQWPDRVLAIKCLSKSLYPSTTEQLLRGVVQTGRALLPQGPRPAQYCWTFDCLRVYVAARADGGCLALLVENTIGVQMVRVQETLQAFTELQQV